MAVQQNSLKYFGGQQSGGESSAKQIVLVRDSIFTEFSEDEYLKCTQAVANGMAVCVQYKVGPVVFQLQLESVLGPGHLRFVSVSPDVVTNYQVAGSAPHTVSILSSGSAKQFVLKRDDMSTAFTYSEYLQCVTRINEGTAVCVQWSSGTATMQAQLATKQADGTLLFSHTVVDLETVYIVAGSEPHDITAHTNSLGGGGSGDQFVLTRANMTTAFTDTEYQDCVDALTNGQAVCLKVGTGANCMQLQLTQNTSPIGLQFEATYGDYHYLYAVAPNVGAHTISENIRHFGVPVYASLQTAIADVDTLYAGTYFETNGFYTSGDGGAARYLVSTTGTANGMDIVSMGGGKLAILQVNANREMYPEQFGYKRDTNRNDLTPYLVRMTTMPNTPVRNIRLMPTGSSAAVYVMRTTWNITAASVSVRGHCEPSSGYATQIWFLPDSYGAEYTPMFKFGQRGFDMKNLVLFNRPWFNEGDKHNCVCLYMALSNTNKMWYDFDSLAIQGFDIGVAKVPPTGELSDGLIWHCEFHRLSMSLNNKNIYIKGLSYVTKFDNCFLTVNDAGAESIVLEETFSTEFDRCNFGIYNPSTTILHCQDFLVSGKPVDVRWMQCKFTNCNFELETNDSHPLPENKSGFFIKCDDHDDFNLELDNCDFIQTPLARNNIYSNRCIRLGARTRIIMRQCGGPYADVNYPGNEFYGWDFQKRMFDGAHPPKKEVGSFKLEHCIGFIAPPNNQWGSAYLPTIMTDNMGCPLCDNNTKFPENYPTASDGIILANLDKANLEVKLGASMVQVTSPGTGKVRIGDRIYDYVTIDGRKWITTNLQLWTMNTRQWHFPDHEEFGFYYGYETFPEVDALLPAGWRRPNYADCQSIINQGYAAVQALGQSAFPNATNTTGLSVLPCYKWFKPNTSVTFNRGFFWGPEEVGVGWHAVNVQAANISYAGWPYSDAKTLKIPLRVCCDA